MAFLVVCGRQLNWFPMRSRSALITTRRCCAVPKLSRGQQQLRGLLQALQGSEMSTQQPAPGPCSGPASPCTLAICALPAELRPAPRCRPESGRSPSSPCAAFAESTCGQPLFTRLPTQAQIAQQPLLHQAGSSRTRTCSWRARHRSPRASCGRLSAPTPARWAGGGPPPGTGGTCTRPARGQGRISAPAPCLPRCRQQAVDSFLPLQRSAHLHHRGKPSPAPTSLLLPLGGPATSSAQQAARRRSRVDTLPCQAKFAPQLLYTLIRAAEAEGQSAVCKQSEEAVCYANVCQVVCATASLLLWKVLA